MTSRLALGVAWLLASACWAQESNSTVRLNCGGRWIAGWAADTNPPPGRNIRVATPVAKVTKAPMAIYQSARTAPRLAYVFPAVTSGWHRVRLHFADLENKVQGERRFNVKLEGVTVLTNLDVAARAGGPSAALCLTFLVPVADSNGLHVAALGKQGADAFVNGVEIDPVSDRPGLSMIPPGSFRMGDAFQEGMTLEQPVHLVTVNSYFMDQTEITLAQWDAVTNWAWTNGYAFTQYASPAFLASNFPVQTVNWHDCVKWCNARSEMENLRPAYYTTPARTAVYRTGITNLTRKCVLWNAGYRLPTEAEWERAARGGLRGIRFPWSDTQTIDHSRANYFSSDTEAYDVSLTTGGNPAATSTVFGLMMPVAQFAPNPYGLYDMAGNAGEWCWDSFSYYAKGPQFNPKGPSGGGPRLIRGGDGNRSAGYCRVASRLAATPDLSINMVGFRTVLPLFPE